MRITEKIELINTLSKVLKEKYDDTDLEIFFNHFGLKIEWYGCGNNKEDYTVDVKPTIANADEDVLIEISSLLNAGAEYIEKAYPKNWENSQNMIKVFISHLSADKKTAKIIKDSLKPYYLDCFVAHEDINPSLEWQDEITKALQTMDVFISLHCENFCNSVWCQQEIGAAHARNIKIIPIKFDGKEDPMGFIGRIQGLSRSGKDRNMLANDIVNIIKTDEKTRLLYQKGCELNEPLIDESEIPF